MGKWYILHVRTGYEERVKKLLEKRVNKDTLNIKQIIIPTEEISDSSKGKPTIKSRKYLPGYILIELEEYADNEIVWYTIRTTPGVLKFLGAGAKPVSLTDKERDRILKEITEKKEKPVPKIEFHKNDKVEITEGPFVNFTGIVEEVYPERERLKVSVSIFGRATLLELDYRQVERI